MAVAKTKVKRYYIQGSIVPFEEDMTHEFKGHRNFAVEEIPVWARERKTDGASRKPVSGNLAAFLNTGKGGTVYLGITDEGEVLGLKLTHYQKDHILGSVHDLFSRYKPPVPRHRYKVKFVPVINKDSSQKDIIRQCSYDSRQFADTSNQERTHGYRSDKYCWCDKDAVAQFNTGLIPSDYVIEVSVKAWDPRDVRNSDGIGSLLTINPIYENEEGQVYLRRQASIVKYSLNDVAQLTRQQMKDACEAEISRLKEEIEQRKLLNSS